MLKNKQVAVLSELRKNSRQSIAEIARKLGIPLSTCHDNYNAAKKCIIRSTCIIDFAAIGYSLRISFMFNAGSIEHLLGNMHMNTLCRIDNKSTYLAECFFKNLNQAYEFKEMLQESGAKKISMRYIIEEIKKESLLA